MNVIGLLLGFTSLIVMGLFTFVPQPKWSKVFKLTSIGTAIAAGKQIKKIKNKS